MKKIIYILAGIIGVCLTGLVAIVLYSTRRDEDESNHARTEAARKARWAKKDMPPEHLVIRPDDDQSQSNSTTNEETKLPN